MADVKWIKIVTDVFDNRKVKQIEAMPDGDSIIVIWFKLLCLAGNINDGGMIYFTKEIPYTEEMMATQFQRPIQTIRLALQVFKQFNMIEIIDNILYISSWEKYQNVVGLEKIREQNRIRKQRQRENDRLLINNVTSHVTVTQSHATDIDIESDKEIDKDIKNKKNSHFVPPSLEEVKAYCKERNNNVDADKFIDHYSANGWYRGKTKIKDWKACVRTWEKSDKPIEQKSQSKPNRFNQFPQRTYSEQDYAELERKLLNKGL